MNSTNNEKRLMPIENRYPVIGISRLRPGTDGDGLRTLILLEGCPLRCKYCLNPFSWNGDREAEYFTAVELYQRIRKDRPYMLATHGGITFGGGEPLLQPGLITEFKEICDERLTIGVETSLNVPWENIEMILESVDFFHVDIKTMDSSIYKSYTGGENSIVINNLKKLLMYKDTEKIIVRIPCIKGFVDNEGRKESREKLTKLGITQFDLFEYIYPQKIATL